MSTVAEFIASLGLEPDEESFHRGDKLLEGIKKGLEILGVVEGARAIKEMIGSTVELGASLVDTSQKVGIGVESLQFFGYVASKNGSSMEGFTDAVKHLSKNIDEARQNGGNAAQAFSRLGIDVSSAAFKHMDLDQQMELVAKRLSMLPDGITKTALAMEIMGRSGADQIATFNDLGKNADELHKTFEEFGGGLSHEQAEQLKGFDDQVKTAKMGLGQFKDQIIAAVVPALGGLVDSFMEWMRANKEAIKEVSERVAEFAVQVIHGFAAVGGAIAKAIAWLEDHKNIAIAALLGLGAAIAAFAVQAAIEWAIAFWPLTLVAGVIAVTSLAIKKLLEWFAGGPISWSKMYAELKQGLVDIEDWFLSIPSKIKGAFDAAWQGIKDAAKAAFEAILNLPVLKQLIQIYEFFTKKQTAKEKEEYEEFKKNLPQNQIAGAVSNTVDNAKSIASGVVDGIGSFLDPSRSMQKAQNSAPISNTISINVTGVGDMDADQLSQKIKDHVTDAIEETHRSALSALTGGQR